MRYLAYVISKSGISVDPQKCEVIRSYTRPRNPKETRTFLLKFLGVASYYRRFVKDFAKIAHPYMPLLVTNKTLSGLMIVRQLFKI